LNAEPILWTALSFFELAEHHFYSALARAGAFDSATEDPAAGSAKGSGYQEQAYFKKCVANGGRAPDDDAKRPK
jgi:hypothetical protein